MRFFDSILSILTFALLSLAPLEASSISSTTSSASTGSSTSAQHETYSSALLRTQIEQILKELFSALPTAVEEKALYIPKKANQNFFPVHSPLKEQFQFEVLEEVFREIAGNGALFHYVDESSLPYFKKIALENGASLFFCRVKVKVVQVPDMYHLIQDWHCHITLEDPQNMAIIAKKEQVVRTSKPLTFPLSQRSNLVRKIKGAH